MPFRSAMAANDGTRAGFEAARQAGHLVAPGGTVIALAVAVPYVAAINRWAGECLVTPEQVAAPGADHLGRVVLNVRARESAEQACMQMPPDIASRAHVVTGATHEVLLAAAADVDLVVMGSHGGGRLLGMAIPSAATEMLRHAPCSVLVARPPFDSQRFPARIAVAVDGSDGSLAALAVARQMVACSGGAIHATVITAGRVPAQAVAAGGGG